jgi:hypothetical protein
MSPGKPKQEARMSISDEVSFWRAKAQQITPEELAAARISSPQTAATLELVMAEMARESEG